MRASVLKKLEDLAAWLGSYPRIAIAYSGGLDSSFLLTATERLTDSQILAVSVHPPYVPDWEMAEAIAYVGTIERAEFEEIPLGIPESVKDNPEQRCYLCKKELFTRIREHSAAWGADVLIDGSNADDTSDYRPGMRALRELEVSSPLLECDFTKDDIREVCREWSLPFAGKPAYSCLLTRIPHDTEVREEVLRQIERAECIMHEMGFTAVRVRHHGDLARIEIPVDHIGRFMSDGIAEKVSGRLKEIGYTYVTLDLGGYVMGNMNRPMEDE